MVEQHLFLPRPSRKESNVPKSNMNAVAKGQIISKWFFVVFDFLQKNERKHIDLRCHSSKVKFFRSFFGENRRHQKPFRNYLTFKRLLSLYNKNVYTVRASLFGLFARKRSAQFCVALGSKHYTMGSKNVWSCI